MMGVVCTSNVHASGTRLAYACCNSRFAPAAPCRPDLVARIDSHLDSLENDAFGAKLTSVLEED
jgi:hypothetical protein